MKDPEAQAVVGTIMGPTEPEDAASPRPAETAAAVTVRFPVAWDQLGWGSAMVGLLAATLWLVVHVRPISVPLVAAYATAYVLNPWVDRMCRWGMDRSLAIAALFLTFLGGATLIGLLLGPQVIAEAQQMPGKLRQVLVVLKPNVEQIFNVQLPDSLDSILSTLQAELAAHEQTPFAAAYQHIGEAARLVFGGTVSALASLGGLAIVPLFAFYFARDFHRIHASLASLWPRGSRPRMLKMVREINEMLGSFVRGQIAVGLILSVMYSVGFVWLKLPLALILGIVTGLGNMVPFVGTAIGLIAALMFCLLSWQGFAQPLGVLAVFVINHALEAWFITPRIVGTSVGLPPFFVITSILVFGEVFGFIGVLVAIPMTATLKICWREWVRQYRSSRFFALR